MTPRSNPRQILWGAYSLVVDLGEQPEQIASQLATIVIGEPGGASSFERFGDRIRGRNYV